MSLDFIRYYFYLEDDASYLADFQSRLNEHNIFCQSSFSQTEGKSCFLQLKNNNINILAVYMSDATYSAVDSEASLQKLEAESMLTTDNLLGKVTVWVAGGEDYTQIKNTLFKDKQEAIQIKMNHGVLSRMTLFWPRGHAQYLCALTQKDESCESFLANRFPMVESGLLQLNLIDNLYRERHMAIDKQTQNLDKRLSVILHTDLVASQSQHMEVEEIESQLDELAKSYGITAGNKNVIMEGINKIKPQIDHIAQQMEEERALLLTPELIYKILAPYHLRLDNLYKTSGMLDVSLESHQAAIGVVESKVQIMNSRQNIATQDKIRELLELNSTLQKQSLTFQIAAAAIEFIVIAYYSHSLWKALAVEAYHAIPGLIQLIFVLLFSTNVVYCTHLVGEYMIDKRDEHVKKNLRISFIILAILCIIILASSLLMSITAP